MLKKRVILNVATAMIFLAFFILIVPSVINGCSYWTCWHDPLNIGCSGEEDCWEERAEPDRHGTCLARCYCPSMHGWTWLECGIPL